MEERVRDYPNLIKVDKSFIVNDNKQQYRLALQRKKTHKKLGDLEDRVSNLENGIAEILDILKGNIRISNVGNTTNDYYTSNPL